MSLQDINLLVKSLPDGQPATIILTDTLGGTVHLPCIYKESEAPSFFLLFLPGVLPVELDRSRQCPLACQDRNGKDVSLVSEIVALNDRRRVELVAKKKVRPEDIRDFFRVDIRTGIVVRFFPENDNGEQQPWEIAGETVDISQSGVLTILPEECRNTTALDLEINLTDPVKKIYCTGHVVRSKRFRKNCWQTSFRFDEISSTAKDAIAKNCFAEQRRQLREKVKTL
jgi:hypothetical protein